MTFGTSIAIDVAPSDGPLYVGTLVTPEVLDTFTVVGGVGKSSETGRLIRVSFVSIAQASILPDELFKSITALTSTVSSTKNLSLIPSAWSLIESELS